MKKLRLPLFALAILIFAFGCEKTDSGNKNGNKENKDSVETANDTTATEPETNELCFLEVTVGEPLIMDGDTHPMIDSMIIRLKVEENKVSGRYDWQPAEKDWMTGDLEGTMEDNMITAIFHWSAEGETGQEEKIFKIEDEKIWEAFGEGTEGEDGVWRLTDKENLKYVQEGVPKVACW